MTRRELLQTAMAAMAASRTLVSAQSSREFCLFSKHLPELSWSDLGKAVKDSGFAGVDLTVRTGGHVLPERAATDLPRAIDAITAQGVKVPGSAPTPRGWPARRQRPADRRPSIAATHGWSGSAG